MFGTPSTGFAVSTTARVATGQMVSSSVGLGVGVFALPPWSVVAVEDPSDIPIYVDLRPIDLTERE